jgi:heterotetrameric sarcosine oxidase gamma subunit
MAETTPVARSAIRPAPPVAVRDGWEVSCRRSHAALRLADHSPLAKVGVRARPDGSVAARLGVPHGRAQRDPNGTLVVGSGPGEWLLLAAPGSVPDVVARVDGDGDGLVSVLDLTHGRALVRLTGAAGDQLLAKVCAIDLSDRRTPNGTAFRSSVAKLVTDVVRDDVEGTRSYLLHCERSSGQYLFDALLDAGRELDVEPEGFDGTEAFDCTEATGGSSA